MRRWSKRWTASVGFLQTKEKIKTLPLICWCLQINTKQKSRLNPIFRNVLNNFAVFRCFSFERIQWMCSAITMELSPHMKISWTYYKNIDFYRVFGFAHKKMLIERIKGWQSLAVGSMKMTRFIVKKRGDIIFTNNYMDIFMWKQSVFMIKLRNVE